jgi:serine/threonine protein phosphatase 1
MRWWPFSRRAVAPDPVLADPAPERPVAVIGDVHGADRLLARLLDRLDRDHPGFLPILVGDLVDRGESSRAVLDLVVPRPDLVCLMGNHERMLLDFLGDPAGRGPRWLRNGGLQTLASFGVPYAGSAPAALTESAEHLASALGLAQNLWLTERPLFWQSGNLAVVHAGADPGLPLANQPETTLIWGHKDFGRKARQDGLWIAHGHTIIDEPVAARGVISVDTGAYATGRLTAALIGDGPVRFVST